MQYPYTSIFPNEIDEQIYFHDVDLNNRPLMEIYDNLIKDGKYTEANNFISQQNDIHNYSADLFNFEQAKIYTMQDYVLSLEKYNPHHFSSTYPKHIKKGETWIKKGILI